MPDVPFDPVKIATDHARSLQQGGPGAPDPKPTALEDANFQAAMQAISGQQDPAIPSDSVQADHAKSTQESDNTIGTPHGIVPPRKLKSLIGPGRYPKSEADAIGMHQNAGYSTRPDPFMGQKVKKYASQRLVQLLVEEGLWRDGRVVSRVTNEDLKTWHAGLMYIGAGLIGDHTPEEGQDALEVSMLSWSDQVISRGQARQQEIIANNQASGGSGDRATVTPEGEAELVRIDKIINAGMNVKARAGDESMQGAFKAFTQSSLHRLRQEKRVDPAIASQLKLQSDALGSTTPVPQDLTRFDLGLDEDDRVTVRHGGRSAGGGRLADNLTGPGRTMARTGEIFRDVEDRLAVPRQIQRHYQHSLSRARRARLGGENLTDLGLMFSRYPDAAIRISEIKRETALIRELDAEEIASDRDFLLELELDKREHLQTTLDDMIARNTRIGTEFSAIQTNETLGFITDIETAVKNGLGDVFEASALVGGLRSLVTQPGRRRFQTDMAFAKVGEAGTEASERAREAMDEYDAKRRQALDQPMEKRWVRTADGIEQLPRRKVPVPPQVVPLEDDNSNIREALISAERAGHMPKSMRVALLSSDPNDMVANAAMLAGDVIAPKTMHRMLNLGIGMEEIRNLYRMETARVISGVETPAIPLGIASTGSINDVKIREEALLQKLSKTTPLGKGWAMTALAYTQARWERGWKELVLDFSQEPSFVADTFIGAAPLMAGGARAGMGALSIPRQRLAMGALHARLRRGLGEAARVDPGMVMTARAHVGTALERLSKSNMPLDKKVVKKRETYEALAAHLERVDAEHHGEFMATVDSGVATPRKKMTSSERKFQRTLRQLNLNELNNLGDTMQIPMRLMQEIQQNPGFLAQQIRGLADRATEWFNLEGKSVRTWTTREGEKIATQMLEGLEQGARPDWETMPTSLEAMRKPRGIIDRLKDRFERRLPGSRRVIDTDGAYAESVVLSGLHKMDDLHAVRHLAGEQRANQVEWVLLMTKKLEGEMQQWDVSLPDSVVAYKQKNRIPLGDEELAILDAKDRARQTITQLEGVLNTIDRTWDQPLSLADTPLTEMASNSDVGLFARYTGAGDEISFYKQNKFKGESKGQFEDRFAQFMSGEMETGRATAMRSSFLRHYVNSPGVSSRQKFDLASGLPATVESFRKTSRARKGVRKAREEYEAIENDLWNATDLETRQQLMKDLASARRRSRFEDPDFDDELLGANLGYRSEDLSADMKELRRDKDFESAQTATPFFERMIDSTDGRMSTLLQSTVNSYNTMLFNRRANAESIVSFEKRYAALPSDQKALADRLIQHLADAGDMQRLRRAATDNPEIAALFRDLEWDKDKLAQSLIEETNHFLANIQAQAHRVGMIDDNQLAALQGGFNPHVFHIDQHEMLLNQKLSDHDMDAVKGEAGPSGMDMSEFMRQKHHSKYKVVVNIKGGKSVTRLVDSPDEAVGFLQESFGIKGDMTQVRANGKGRGIATGNTNLGDSFAVLEPLSDQLQSTLGILDPGPGLFSRLETFNNDIHKAQLINTFNRPGWAYDEKAYRRLVDSLDDQDPQKVQLVEQYETVSAGPRYGKLAGQVVHKKVLSAVDEALDAEHRMGAVAEMVQKAMKSNNLAIQGAAGAVWLGTSVLQKTKDALVTNKIARALSTMFYNVLMDSEMFGVMAAGRDFSVTGSLAGWRARGQAVNDLFEIFNKGKHSALYEEATRMGIVDDTIMSHRPDPQVTAGLRDLVWGEGASKRWPHMKRQFRQTTEGLVGGKGRGIDAVRKLAGDSDDVVVKNMLARYDKITDDLENISPEDDLWMPLTLEQTNLNKKFRELEPSTRNSIVNSWHAMTNLAVGDKKKGLFKDQEVVSREFYGRISNMGRLSAYYHLRNKGMSPENAARRVNMYMQTYSAVPDLIKRLGKSPIGSPIVGFPYEMLRIGANVALNNPSTLLGVMSAVSATNFISMVAGGLNPYRVAEGMSIDSAGFPGALNFASTLISPNGDGTWSTGQVSGMNPLQLFREPFGVGGKIWGYDDNPALTAGDVARAVGSKFIGGNIVATSIYAGARGLDPKTGHKMADQGPLAWLGAAGKEVAEMFIPPELPFIGSNVRDVADGIERPAYARSQFEVSTLQRIVQSWTGVRVRGSLLSSNRIAQPLSDFLGISAWTDLPVDQAQARPFDNRAVDAALYVTTRAVDPSDVAMERVSRDSFRKLRVAQDLLARDDEESNAQGLRMREEALAEFEAETTPLQTWHSKEFQRSRTLQERTNFLLNVYKTQDMNQQFDSVSIARKAQWLVGMVLTGMPSQDIEDRIDRTLFMAQRPGQLRNFTSEASLDKAINILTSHLEQPAVPGHEKGLSDVRDMLQVYREQTRINTELKNAIDANRRDMSDAFFGGDE